MQVEHQRPATSGHRPFGNRHRQAHRLRALLSVSGAGFVRYVYGAPLSGLAVLERLRAKDPWARFSTDAFEMKDKAELTSAERVMGLMLFWSEAKYNFAYWDRVPELDWNQTLLEYLPRVSGEQSTLEYYRTLQEMCALLKDAHTNVYLPGELFQKHEQRPPARTVQNACRSIRHALP